MPCQVVASVPKAELATSPHAQGVDQRRVAPYMHYALCAANEVGDHHPSSCGSLCSIYTLHLKAGLLGKFLEQHNQHTPRMCLYAFLTDFAVTRGRSCNCSACQKATDNSSILSWPYAASVACTIPNGIPLSGATREVLLHSCGGGSQHHLLPPCPSQATYVPESFFV